MLPHPEVRAENTRVTCSDDRVQQQPDVSANQADLHHRIADVRKYEKTQVPPPSCVMR